MKTSKRIESSNFLPKKCQVWWKEEVERENAKNNQENENSTQKWISKWENTWIVGREMRKINEVC